MLSDSYNNELEELFHSIGASFVQIIIYAICLFIVEPVANILLSWYVSHFVSIIGNVSILRDVAIYQMILRVPLALICSSYIGYLAGLKLFPKQRSKHSILLFIVLVILVPVMLIEIELNNRIKQIKINNTNNDVMNESKY